MTKNDERIGAIDLFRGYGIILMIMGHIGFGELFDLYIHAFHMPLFFFISGFLYRKNGQSYKVYINKKLKRLIVPYIFFGIINYLIWIFLFKIILNSDLNLFDPLLHIIFINTSGMPIAGALWFLTCIFWVEIIFDFLKRKIKSNKLLFISILLLFIIGMLFYEIFDFQLPLAFDISLIAIFIYYIGYMFKEKKIYSKKISIIFVLFILLMNLILILKSGYVNMRMGIYPSIILFLLNSILACAGYYYLFKIIDNIDNKLIKKIKKCLSYIGKNSIIYVCINELVIMIIMKIFMIMSIPNYIISIMVLIVALIIITITSEIINRTKLKILIGKFN